MRVRNVYERGTDHTRLNEQQKCGSRGHISIKCGVDCIRLVCCNDAPTDAALAILYYSTASQTAPSFTCQLTNARRVPQPIVRVSVRSDTHCMQRTPEQNNVSRNYSKQHNELRYIYRKYMLLPKHYILFLRYNLYSSCNSSC